ncbi:MAG: hypothetical protein WBN89_09650 [Prochlorococcaceae cyanobacterium]
MAPHTLLIERAESHGIAWPRIKKVVAHQWELGIPEMAWLCFCPPEAVRITRVGPVHLAHGGDWARCRELESLRWKLLYPIPLSIRGKAIAVRPDRERPGCWRALSEWEASNAERVFRAHGLMLNQPSADRWHGLRMQIHGEWSRRLYLARSDEQREAALTAFALHRAEVKRAARAIEKPSPVAA